MLSSLFACASFHVEVLKNPIIARGPYFLPAYVNLAELYRQRDRDEAGETILREALARFPDSAEVHHALGLLLVRSRRADEALKALHRAAVLSPGSPRYAYVYGVALNSAGEPQRALAVLAEAHRLNPGAPELLVALATIHRACPCGTGWEGASRYGRQWA